MPAVNILNLIHKAAAAMWPLFDLDGECKFTHTHARTHTHRISGLKTGLELPNWLTKVVNKIIIHNSYFCAQHYLACIFLLFFIVGL